MELKNRNYKVIDYIRIPYEIEPLTIIFMVFLRVFIAIIPTLQVLAITTFIDTALDVFNKGETSRIYMSLVAIMLLVGFSWVSSMLLSFVRLRIEIKLDENIRPAIIEKRSRLAYYRVENNESWELLSRVGEDTSDRILKGFDNLLNIIEYVIKISSLVILITAYVWWVGVAVIVISVPLFSLAFKSGKVDYEAFSEAQKYRRRADYLKEVISSRECAEERSLFGYTKELDNMWFERYETAREIEFKATKRIFIKTKTASIITAILSMAIALLLLTPVNSGAITVGLYMSLVTATFKLVKQMSWELAMIMKEYAKNKLYLNDLTKFSALEEVPGAHALPDVSVLKEPFESIEFKDVHFSYPGTDTKILKGLSMTLEKDKQYAFVGKNGAGKTTITKLLTGLYDNYEGDILINGKNLKTFTKEQLKACFSVVYQDFAKYSISVKDNVLLGDYGLDGNEEEKKTEVEKILTKIQLDEDIKKMHKGIETTLGKISESGIDLSGGQWQRVAIARTLISKAPIYILDEPTAALDPISESNLYKLFNKISSQKTTILITHRLGAARSADEILVVDDGVIAERGSHDKLLHKKGIYEEMFKAQRSWYNE